MKPSASGAASTRLFDAARSVERFRFTTTRPVAVFMVFLAVVVFGVFSIPLLPLNLMPDISYPKLTVRTEYAGAAPAEVENNISRVLEESLGVVTGLTRIESVSRAGYSDVVLEFTWDTDMDDANQDVLEKIDAVKAALPDDVGQPLILRYDPTLDPVMTLSVGGTGERFEGIAGLKLLRRIADRDVRRLIEPIEGVAAVKVKGGLEEEIHVELDEGQLRRTGIGIDTVIRRLDAENIDLAGGTMRDGRTRYLVRTVSEFRDLEDIRNLVILSQRGRDIRLRDLGAVESGYAERDIITRVDGHEAVEVEVYKEADANIVDMADRVRERLDTRVRSRVGDQYGAEIVVVADRSRFIQSSIDEVRNTAVLGGVLAVFVLLVFLRDLRSTVIVAISIPVSVLITFAPLNLAGVSLNIMSLGGLALGIGMLVDNSIVVLESIHRCRQEGDDLVQATMRGTSEVGSAVFASTLTSIAVFFPMVFVEGVAGQMFGDLGLSVVFSLLASLAVALFLIPMLTSLRLGTPAKTQGIAAGLVQSWGRWAAFGDLRQAMVGARGLGLLLVPWALLRFLVGLVFELVGKILLTAIVVALALGLGPVVLVWRVAAWITRPVLRLLTAGAARVAGLYPRLIRWCLRNRPVIYAASLAAFTAMGWGLARLDAELIPELHQGELGLDVTMPVGTPLSQTQKELAPLERALVAEVKGVRTVATNIGSVRGDADSSLRGEHTGRLRLLLEDPMADTPTWQRWLSRTGLGPRGRDMTAQEEYVAAQAREAAADIPDLEMGVTRPVLFSFKPPIEVEVRGHDLEDLATATTRVAERLESLGGLTDVNVSIRPGNPEVHIVYDRDALARLGLDIRQVAELVRDKVQGNEATRMTRRDRKIPVRVRGHGVGNASVEELRELAVNPGGPKPIELDAVADLEIGRGPSEIRRIGQRRVGLVTANVAGVGLTGVAARLQADLATLDTLPPGVTTAVTGQSQEWETSSRSLYLALGLSVFLVYVIMASQFESLIYPLIILVTIPLALVGVVGALVLLDMPISVVVFLGAIMLAGIVVNNAIVLVDYAGQLKARGHETAEALEIAGRVRLRPILMTTLTTILGLLPMAFGMGDGAEVRMPMAITVIAGLGLSTLLTLVVIPTLYAGVDALRPKTARPAPAAMLAREVAAIEPAQLTPEEADAGQDERDGDDAVGEAEDPAAEPADDDDDDEPTPPRGVPG